jgi:hypothetical protein
MEAERGEQAQDRPGLRGARRVVVAGHHHDLRVRQRVAQPRELEIRVQDRRVGRPDLMEDVARDEHEIGRERDHLVQRARERLRHIRLALIDPARSQPLILAVAEMNVGEVDEAQKLGGREVVRFPGVGNR